MKISDILKKPLITEKSLQEATQGFYTFEVDKRANKHQIKQAVADHFKVEVVSVKTLNYQGKKRRFGKKRVERQTPAFKKALVKLKNGQKIDIFEISEKKAKKE